MPSSSQTPVPLSSTSAFTNLVAAIDRKVSSDRAAELLGDFRAAVRAEVLAEAIEAARAEFLTDGSGESEDDSYNQGVTDSVEAISALLEGGAA